MKDNTVQPVGLRPIDPNKIRLGVCKLYEQHLDTLSPEERSETEARVNRLGNEVHESDPMGGG